MRRLLVVEETFEIRGRGVIVAPFLDASEAKRERFQVELRKPDGQIAHVSAFVQIPFFSPPSRVPRAQLMLFGVTKPDVPVGTEVWAIRDPRRGPTRSA